MTRAELLTELRYVVDDAHTVPYWSDARLLSFLAEGQDEFCERTGFFRDISTYTATLASGTDSYAIDSRIIEIMSVWNGTTRLAKYNEQDRAELNIPWESFLSASQSGTPTGWQTDRITGYITFYPTPAAADEGTELTLWVHRYSLYDLANNDIDGEGTDAEPEIPTRFHWALIEWAAHRAYETHDSEIQDAIKSRDHLAMFDSYVTKGKEAFRRLHGTDVTIGSNPSYRA